ncbi:DoxX family protein [Bogoriella caseilytica]|uniref:Putative membrane protein n=1 Tax=Bogoriella caseilytica TaxID=56055 RepID=A0A3N2BGJ3_9MICO|nr:DoxX family membrane protein [Bogoriella caseilytica]ROR74369.1 putative membrane protein [Bogoriella caseilytica]
MSRPPRNAVRSLTRWALGSALVFAGIGHLTFAREEFQAQVPPWVPVDDDVTVLASGVAEIGLGAALLSGWRKRAVGHLAAAFFVAVFPGNLSQWKNRRDAFGLDTDRKRLLRLPFQIPLIAAAIWSTRPRRGATAV